MAMLLALSACGDSGLAEHTKQLRTDETLTILEGLPHQMFEREVYERELKRKDVRRIMDYPFYEGGMKVKDADVERLRKLIGDPKRYEMFMGEKLCGGFHPDYAIGVSTGWTLLCFGCGEAWHDGDKIHKRYDVADMKEIQEVIGAYREKRPESKL